MRKKTGETGPETRPEKTYAVKLTKDELSLLFLAVKAVTDNLGLRRDSWLYVEDKENWEFILSEKAYEVLRSAKLKVMAVGQDVAAGRAA